jgi:hypothetical protein
MAEGLILEFDGLDVDDYKRVNEQLGIEMESGEGDWPVGMITHVGGAKDGGWVVFELWASRADQERFLADRLGPALGQAGIEGPPARMEWIEVAAHQTPGS